MDRELRERIERAAEEHALFNALKHDDEADPGAIMGPLMGEHPEFRSHGGEVPDIIAPVIAEVNELAPADRRERLAALAPDRVAELEADDESDDETLPSLPNADDVEQVRLRCAPNPNGPWHIGHARMPAVIGTYKERYDGWFACRFDDTDPETKRPDLRAYDWILEDIDYLGFEPDRVLRASDRLDTYYEHARELIDLGGAYTCSCSGEEFSALKNAGEACPHRDKSVKTSHDEFATMVDGGYDAGEMVLRVKTDIEHPNPALRDWVAFRIVDTPHPREEVADFRCWPMLDFQSGIDDHLLGITHIIRGIDLQDSAKRQQFVYDDFGWTYPEVVHWGHVQVDEYDVRLSTSRIAELIETGALDGWDDPSAPTIRSLRRRGIQGEALTDAMIELGTSTSNVDLAMSSVYARNRELIDPIADRYFLVRDGHPFDLAGSPPETARPPRHPEEDRGERDIPVGDRVLIEPGDIPEHGDRVWLKGFGCVQLTRDALLWTGDDIDVVREGDVPVIHWVPENGTVEVTVRGVTDTTTGRGEPALAETHPDELIQFERIGFARVDERSDDALTVYFAHQ